MWEQILNEANFTHALLPNRYSLIPALEQRGCDAVHVSTGGLDPAQQIPVGPSYQVPQARAIKAAVRMPVVAVGLITGFDQAEAIVSTGDADLIWEGHRAGREIGYSHLEKLHNLEFLPSDGFDVVCFPVKVHRASAGWTRAVAILNE